MRSLPRALSPGLLLMAVLVLAGCAGGAAKIDGPVYKQVSEEDLLQIPPDLDTPEYDASFAIPKPGERVRASSVGTGEVAPVVTSTVLPGYQGIDVVRAGSVRWLEVKAPPEALWETLRQFWRKQGLKLKVDDPITGVMETEWAEDRAGITASSWRRFLGPLRDAGTRDKYRLRVERGQGVTRVFVTHQGAREAALGGAEVPKWVLAPADPALEDIMLSRLMVHLGMNQGGAEQALTSAKGEHPAVRLSAAGGRPVLTIEAPLDDALWRWLGLALERAGLVVQSQDRDAGVFSVSERGRGDKARGRGFFGGDGLKDRVRYQVHLVGRGGSVDIVVRDAHGGSLGITKAEAVLKRLEAELG